MKPVSFFVAGLPKPQGSKRAFMPPNARHPVVVESAGEPLKDWRASVSHAAQEQAVHFAGPVAVLLAFTFPRPKGHFGTGRNSEVLKASAPVRHTKKPDIDKLSRAVLDALTHIVFADDSAVIELQASKEYGVPGCQITVEART